MIGRRLGPLGLRVMFMTPEDKTDADNLCYPAILYEKQRRPILTACMLGIEGAVRREGPPCRCAAVPVTLQQAEEDLGNDPAPDRAEPLAVRQDCRFAQDVDHRRTTVLLQKPNAASTCVT